MTAGRALGVGSSVTVGAAVSVIEGVSHSFGSAVSATCEAPPLGAAYAPGVLRLPEATYADCEVPDVAAGVIERMPVTLRPTTTANAMAIAPKPANQPNIGPRLSFAPAARGGGNRQP